MSDKKEIIRKRQLELLEEEKKRWMQKSYDEIAKLGIGMVFEDPYGYEKGQGDEQRWFEVEMIENRPDYFHLQISVMDEIPEFRILWFWPVNKTIVLEWKVYKDGRVES